MRFQLAEIHDLYLTASIGFSTYLLAAGEFPWTETVHSLDSNSLFSIGSFQMSLIHCIFRVFHTLLSTPSMTEVQRNSGSSYMREADRITLGTVSQISSCIRMTAPHCSRGLPSGGHL